MSDADLTPILGFTPDDGATENGHWEWRGPDTSGRPPVADSTGDPRWQAVRVLRRNPAYLDPWTPAAATVEALEAAGLRIVHADSGGDS